MAYSPRLRPKYLFSLRFLLLQPLASTLAFLACAAATLPQPALPQPALPQPALPQPAQTARLPRALAVGDTVYVVPRFLNVRPSPQAKGPGNPKLYVGHNHPGTVVALPNRNWARVLFMSEDVGFEGYVSQWYLSKVKTKREY